MDFNTYQAEAISLCGRESTDHRLIPLLGLGAHVGALLHAQQRYLQDAVHIGASTARIGRELGEVLRWSALVAGAFGIDLNGIALQNLAKIDDRAQRLDLPRIELHDLDQLDLTDFQRRTSATDQDADDGLDPLSLSVPMLGLIGEAGVLLGAVKKQIRDRVPSEDELAGLVSEELGDLLWYVAAVARHSRLDLEDVAQNDLKRAAWSKSLEGGSLTDPSLPVLDLGYPDIERLPRQLVLRFTERTVEGESKVTMTLLDAFPNHFPDGPIPVPGEKDKGFWVGRQLGAEVADNSRRSDAYRYHDAIHLGFLTVLGWSPNLRGLLRLKRKSDPVVDDNEDGARAVFAEEGLAAVLAKRADESQRFASPRLVGEDLVELITTVLEDLEVAVMPPWLWREAISQGFNAMQALSEGRGGYLIADLDHRSLTYSKLPPVRQTSGLHQASIAIT